MSPVKLRTPYAVAPTAASWGTGVQPALTVVSFGEFDRNSTALRCVAAAEIYKHTGRLPAWAH